MCNSLQKQHTIKTSWRKRKELYPVGNPLKMGGTKLEALPHNTSRKLM
jgi:hypothetical protein